MRRAQRDIPFYRFIIAATLVFIVGLFVFTVIFRAWLTFEQLSQAVLATGDYSEEESTLLVLGIVPWALGGIYVSLLGVIIYFLLKSTKQEKSEPPPSTFRRY
jgi:uncharacterized BrkB/YihY/UPF0761 family membrane protein